MSTTTDQPDTVAGEGTIIPGGPAAEDRPLADRLERDPSNLGDEIKDDGDIVYPTPEPTDNNL